MDNVQLGDWVVTNKRIGRVVALRYNLLEKPVATLKWFDNDTRSVWIDYSDLSEWDWDSQYRQAKALVELVGKEDAPNEALLIIRQYGRYRSS